MLALLLTNSCIIIIWEANHPYSQLFEKQACKGAFGSQPHQPIMTAFTARDLKCFIFPEGGLFFKQWAYFNNNNIHVITIILEANRPYTQLRAELRRMQLQCVREAGMQGPFRLPATSTHMTTEHSQDQK